MSDDDVTAENLPSTVSARSEFVYRTHLVIYNFLRLVPSSLSPSPTDEIVCMTGGQETSAPQPGTNSHEDESQRGGGDGHAVGNGEVHKTDEEHAEPADRQGMFAELRDTVAERDRQRELLAAESRLRAIQTRKMLREFMEKVDERENRIAGDGTGGSFAPAVTIIKKKNALKYLVDHASSVPPQTVASSLPTTLPFVDASLSCSPLGNPLRSSTPACLSQNATPPPSNGTDGRNHNGGVERSPSWGSSASSTYIDIELVDDIESLVNAGIVPPVCKSLKDEISLCWQNLERSRSRLYNHRGDLEDIIDGGETHSPPVAIPGAAAASSIDDVSMATHPQLLEPDNEAVVAEYLRVIGDRLELEYGDQLDGIINGLDWTMAVDRLLADGRRAFTDLVSRVSDVWTRVTVTLLFCQRLVYALLRHGWQGIGDVVELTVKSIEDSAAAFILNNGGWRSVAELGAVADPLMVDLPDNLHSEALDHADSKSADPCPPLPRADLNGSNCVDRADAASRAEHQLCNADRTESSDATTSLVRRDEVPAESRYEDTRPSDSPVSVARICSVVGFVLVGVIAIVFIVQRVRRSKT